MEIETSKLITTTITLNETEAKWLKGLVQNTQYATLNDEPMWEQKLRLELFRTLLSQDESNE